MVNCDSFELFLHLLDLGQRKTVAELAVKFEVSVSTIRRRIDAINELAKTYGYKTKCISGFEGKNGGVEISKEFILEHRKRIVKLIEFMERNQG